jgi:hypothetical protein
VKYLLDTDICIFTDHFSPIPELEVENWVQT